MVYTWSQSYLERKTSFLLDLAVQFYFDSPMLIISRTSGDCNVSKKSRASDTTTVLKGHLCDLALYLMKLEDSQETEWSKSGQQRPRF